MREETKMNLNIASKYKSRKFIVAVVTIVAVIVGLPEASQQSVITLAMMYIGGQGVVDTAAAWKKRQ